MGLFNLFRRKKAATDNDRQRFTATMEDNAARFVNECSQRYEGLDYSVASLQTLDKILEDDTELYKHLDDEHKEELIEKAGSYIFEVAARNFGGVYYWYDSLDQPIFVTGQPEFEMGLLAYEKVKGRFENGQEDNIPFFFDGYIQGVRNKESSVIV